MTEEIKEILNNLRYTAKEHTIQVLENGGMIEHCPQQISTEMRLNSYSVKLLLDYITNLRQEINKLTAESTEWESKYYDLQQENEKIKNFITNLISELNHWELNGTKKLDIVSDYIKQEYEKLLNGDDENE